MIAVGWRSSSNCPQKAPLPAIAGRSFASNVVDGAHFLPFDLDSFRYSTTPSFRLPDQLEQLRRLNAIVQQTAQTTTAQQLLKGWYPPNGPNNTKSQVCDGQGELMPHALLTQDSFWKSPARAHVLGILGITQDACAP